jgi:hypothetical protein
LYGAKKACEPVHIQLNQNDWHAMAVNTLPWARADLTARIRIFDLNGILKSERNIPLSAKALAATDLGAVEFPAALTPVHFVKLELRDAAGGLLSDNFYWRTTALLTPGAAPAAGLVFGAGGAGGRGTRGGATGPAGFGGGLGGGFPGSGPAAGIEDFSLLETLPTAELQVALNRHDSDGKVRIDATIANTGRVPALQAHVQLRNGRTNQRLLPAFYSDNYISLLPGESRTIAIEAGNAALGGERALVTLDGWNVTVAGKSFGDAEAALNKDAFVAPKAVTPAAPAAE